MTKKFRIKYNVHCLLQNFFDKEIVIKECMSEMHAKVKLNEYCKKNYTEFCYIIIKFCKEEDSIGDLFGDIFPGLGDLKGSTNSFNEILKNLKKTKK